MSVVLHGKQIIDGTGNPPIDQGSVRVENGRIAEVGPRARVSVPDGVRVVEMPDHTLAPGLIDVHSHISLHTLNDELAQTARDQGEVALWGAHWLRQDLRSGVTTMRTLGDRRFLDVIFKRAQDAGIIEIPRLQVAGHLLLSSLVEVSVSEAVADGPDALRRYIRESVRAGVDWIKYYATPNSRADDPTMSLYSRAEVEVIYEEARRVGKPVAAHCHGGVGADWAIELGVDSLEHGLYLEERHFHGLGEKGIVLVPTTGVVLMRPDEGAGDSLIRTKERARSFLLEARRHGVKCIPGSDAVHGNFAFEMLLMIECGWSPQEALENATREAAKLLGLSADVGTLEPGKLGDVVAFRGDPLDDPKAFEAVDLVVQSGRVVHHLSD